MNQDWRYSDDPTDPCLMCVQWQNRNDRPTPVMPDGKVAPFIYGDVHPGCRALFDAYMGEVGI